MMSKASTRLYVVQYLLVLVFGVYCLSFELFPQKTLSRTDFSLCGTSQNGGNVPRRLYADVLAENEYELAFWDRVSFPPMLAVPAFDINTHYPVCQDIYISGIVHGSGSVNLGAVCQRVEACTGGKPGGIWATSL